MLLYTSNTGLLLLLLLGITGCCWATNCPHSFTSSPDNYTDLIPGQPGPLLQCDSTGLVDWYQILNGERVLVFGASNASTNLTMLELFLRNLFDTTAITLDDSTRKINFTVLKTRQHGHYQCKISSCEDIYSNMGSIYIQSAVEMEFEGETNPQSITLPAKAGQDFYRTLRVYGAPTPAMSIAKQGSDGIFRDISNDGRISVTVNGLTFRSIQLRDSGFYEIWGNNSHGNVQLRFNISVTGVDAPNITLSNTKHTPSQYGTSFTTSCTIQQSAYESTLRLYWAFDNSTPLPLQGSIVQNELGNTTIVLTINTFEESHNGRYICFANNSNDETSASVTIIGPPAKVNKPDVGGGSGAAVIDWTPPNSYGANITHYIIQYRIQNSGNSEIVREVITNYAPDGYVDHSFCPGGFYSFRIAAVNEYGNQGQYSEYSEGKVIGANCPSNTDTSTNTASAVIGRTVTISTTINDRTMMTMVTGTPTVLTVSPSITFVTTTEPQTNSIPLVAGASAGALVLITVVGLLVMALFCWLSVSRRSSQRQGRTQWRHPGEEDNIDASLSSQSLPDKSPELHVDILGLPSPLPATPGYGPVYIDPCYEFSRDNLELTDILYDGNYTVIYKAKAAGIRENKTIEVAVKTIKEEYLEVDELTSSLVMEMEQMSQLEPHPNIVGLIRVCTVGRPVYMVMEYMCHGDLLGFLRATRGHSDMYTVFPGTKNIPTNVKLRSRDLLNIIGQVASGMQFLSELKVPHGALCARNVLVGTSMEVKLFNIGAHNIDNGDNNSESLIRWLAPEVLMNGHRTTYSDVWSFGVLMWEVVTVGGTPYSEIQIDELYTHLSSGMRLQRPTHCPEPLYDIMSSCWEAIPQHRQFFIEIIDQLQSLNMSKMSFLDLRNYNEMQYSQFDLNEASQMSVL